MKSECVKKFDTVRSLYGFEEEAVPRPVLPVAFEFAEKPTAGAMESCHKIFGFSKTEALLPIDDRLALMCKKYNQLLQRVSVSQQQKQQEQREEQSKASMEEMRREAEATHLRVQAERDYEMKKREKPTLSISPIPADAPPCLPNLPTENVVVLMTAVENCDTKSDSGSSTSTSTPKRERDWELEQIPPQMVGCLEYLEKDDLPHDQTISDDLFQDIYARAQRYLRTHDSEMIEDLIDTYNSYINKKTDLYSTIRRARSIVSSA